MAVTIYDVAEAAGVSTATVSKVLSETPYVGETTRLRVLETVSRLGYVPSLAARGLTRSRTFIIGVAFPYVTENLLSDPHLMTFLQGVERVLAESDYNILLTPARPGATAASGLARLLKTQYVDGAIVVGLQAALDAGMEINSRHLPPTVALGYHSPRGTRNTIHADDRKGGYEAAKHLLNQGHKRIGVISAAEKLTALSARLEGYRQALAEMGGVFAPELVVYGDLSEASGSLACRSLLELDTPPTAIFALNDRMAIGAIQHLKQRELSTPDEIAIVGFDDIPAAQFIVPSLTTVQQPSLAMGRKAAEMLLQMINGEVDSHDEVVFPTRLIVRESSRSRRPDVAHSV